MSNNKRKVVIESIGGYLPERTFSNNYLREIYKCGNEEETMGISIRHVAGDYEYLSDIAIKAATKCLDNNISEIQCVIVASMTPDNRAMATAPIIAHKLGLGNIPAYDVRAGETGGLYALQNAVCFIKSGQYKRILVIAADINSKYINYKNCWDAQIFGDGAVAILLSDLSNNGIFEFQDSYLDSFDDYYSAKILPVGGCANYYKISSEDSFKQDDLYWNIDYKKLENLAGRVLNYIFEQNLCSVKKSDKYIMQLINPKSLDHILNDIKISKAKFVNCQNIIGDIGTATTFYDLLYAFDKNLLKNNECISIISCGTGGSFGIMNWSWIK